MPYLETPDGINLYYCDEGPRTTSGLFLIHPGPFSLKLWRNNIPALARDFRVVAMDVRGHGNSGKTGDGHSFGQYARDAYFLARQLGLEEFVGVGWSFGGAIFWSLMQQYGQDQFAGYVNVDQRPYRFVSEMSYRQHAIGLHTRRLSLQRETIRAFWGPEIERDEEVVEWMVHECMRTPTHVQLAIWDEAYHCDYRPVMANVHVPSRLYWAKYGNINAEEVNHMQQSTKNCKMVYFEHSGHLFPWLEADRFNDELSTFAHEVLSSAQK